MAIKNRSFLEDILKYEEDNTLSIPELSAEDYSETYSDMLNEMVMSEQFCNELLGERIEPDHFGCYSLFCSSFVNSAMYDDFPHIANVFLSYCTREKIEKYTQVSFSVRSQLSDDLYAYFVDEIMSMMVAAFEEGDDFVCRLFVNMHKLFYKKEYKYLKRFSKINAREVISISEDETPGGSLYAIARILCICEAMHIEIMPNCDALYNMLNKMNSYVEQKKEVAYDYPAIEESAYVEGLKWIDGIEAEIEKRGIRQSASSFMEPFKERDIMRMKEYKPWQRARKLLSYTLNSTGFCPDYSDKCGPFYVDEAADIAEVRAVLKELFPKEEVSFEETQSLTVLFRAVKNLGELILQTADLMDEVLGYQIFDEYDRERIFEDSMFPKIASQQVTNKPAKEKSAVMKTDTPNRNCEEDLLAEVKELREKIHVMEQKAAKLQYLNVQSRKTAKDYENLQEEYKSQKDELVALREYVYKMTDQEDASLPEEDTESMQSVIAKRKVVVIGGHSNWVNKLKNMFPAWSFLSPRASGSVDNKLVSNADYVYFFTDCIKHSTYYRFINIVREEGKSFGYIHSVNIENNIRQIYRDFESV